MLRIKSKLFYSSIYSQLLILLFGLLSFVNFTNLLDVDSYVSDAAPSLPALSEPVTILPSAEALSKSVASSFARVVVSPPRSAKTNAQSTDAAFYIDSYRSVSDTQIDAGRGVNRYRNLFYAHSTLAFRPLKSLHEGNIISINENGEVVRYRIDSRYVFNHNAGTITDSAGRILNYSVINNTSYLNRKYDIAFMTCGNGSNDDPNYRLVLFASRA